MKLHPLIVHPTVLEIRQHILQIKYTKHLLIFALECTIQNQTNKVPYLDKHPKRGQSKGDCQHLSNSSLSGPLVI